MSDDLVIRGTESEVRRFNADLATFLAARGIRPGTVALPQPQPIKRKLTDPAPLGHEAELLLEIGKWVATALIAPIAKDLIVAFAKDWWAKRGRKAKAKSG